MNLETLRKRLSVRLTTLPEVLFALTRHWFILIFALGIGTVFMLAKVSTDPVIYEGKATLLFNVNESVVVDQSAREERGREESQRFFNSRVDILKSDSVLRKLSRELKTPNILAQEENPEEPNYGYLRRLVSDLKKRISEAFSYLEHPTTLDYGEENEIQKAVTSFRGRSMAIPNPQTNSVELRVYGNNRELLLKELDQWIEAYVSRLVEMAKESRDFFISSRMRYWTDLEKKAQENLDTFKKENPDVSKAAHDFLLQDVMQFQVLRADIQRHLQSGGEVKLPLSDDPRLKDPEVQSLVAQKRALEAERAKLLPLFPVTSDRASTIQHSIDLIDSQLKGIDLGGDDAKRAQLVAEEQRMTAVINETMKRYTGMAEGLEKLQSLEEDFKHAQKTKKSYELMSLTEADRNESQKNVQVQVGDRPFVRWKPFNTYPHRQVLYGSLAGIGVGIFLALLLELFTERVRFKNDIQSEFGVPVVAIIPRR